MSLLDNYRNRHRWVVRGPLKDITQEQASRDYDSKVGDISNCVALLNGEMDEEIIRGFMKQRFAYGISEAKYNPTSNPNLNESYYDTIEYYARGEVHAAIDAKFIEAVNTGTGRKIMKALGCLNNAPDANWSYVDSEKKDKNGKQVEIEEVGTLLAEVREQGNFGQHFESLDYGASSLELCYLHVSSKGYDLNYDVVTPEYIWVICGDYVTSYMEGAPRPIKRSPDRTDINDASAVIIQLGGTSSSSDDKTYQAYVGGCEGCEDGRLVTYQAQEHWPIPEKDDANKGHKVLEEYTWQDGGTPCNPLTYMLRHGRDEEKKLVHSEYPIIPWRGGHRTIETTTTPITTGIYNATLEIELAWSRLLKYSMDNARGKDIFGYDITKGSPGTGLPQSLEVIVLREGMTYDKVFGGATEIQALLQVVDRLTNAVASSYHVPVFLVDTMQATNASGISLAIQSQPLIQYRGRKYNINKDAAQDIFNAERALLVINFGMSEVGIAPTIKQRWDPGTWTPPRDEMTRINEIVAAREAELIDHPEAVRMHHELPTIAEAEALIETMTERDEDYGGKPEEENPFGGFAKPPEPEQDEEDDGQEGKTSR